MLTHNTDVIFTRLIDGNMEFLFGFDYCFDFSHTHTHTHTHTLLSFILLEIFSFFCKNVPIHPYGEFFKFHSATASIYLQL